MISLFFVIFPLKNNCLVNPAVFTKCVLCCFTYLANIYFPCITGAAGAIRCYCQAGSKSDTPPHVSQLWLMRERRECFAINTSRW